MNALPESMRCIDIATPGGPEVLRIANRPVPRPGAGEVLIQTVAAGVNRADLLQRQGHYPPPPGASPILGMELSGHIVELGASAQSRWQMGDAVCALLAGGGYAEYCAVPEGQCMAVPAGVSIRDAAAFPKRSSLYGPISLSHAASLPAISFWSRGDRAASAPWPSRWPALLAPASPPPPARTRNAASAAVWAPKSRSTIESKTAGDWAAEIARWAQPHGLDAILDMIGGDYFPKHLDLLATGGRLVHIATSHGSQVTADLRAIMVKRLLITGSTLRSRSVRKSPRSPEPWNRSCGHCSLADSCAPSSTQSFPWTRPPTPTA